MAFPDTDLPVQFTDDEELDAILLEARITAQENLLAARVRDGGWITPALIAPWVAFGGATAAPQYRVKAGLVFFKGAMKSGALSTTIFTLAAGARPLDSQGGVVASGGTGAATWSITAAGLFSLTGYLGTGSNTLVSLDSIRFIAEQ